MMSATGLNFRSKSTEKAKAKYEAPKTFADQVEISDELDQGSEKSSEDIKTDPAKR